jgi:hypothetical protein
MSNGRKFVVITPQNNTTQNRLVPMQRPTQSYISHSNGVPYRGSFAVKRHPAQPIKVIRPIMPQNAPSPRQFSQTSNQMLSRRPVNLPIKSVPSPQNRQKRPSALISKHDNQHNEDLEEV